MDILSYLMGKKAGGIDTSDATATADKIVKDYTAYVNGEKVTGTLQAKSANNAMFQEANSFTTKDISMSLSVAPVYIVAMCWGFSGNENSANYICGVFRRGTSDYVAKTDGSSSTVYPAGLFTYNNGTLTMNDPAENGMTGVKYAKGNWVVIAISNNIA